MDCLVSKKERRLQKGELVDVYVNDVFDKYAVMAEDGITILNVETIDDVDEIQQSALFASLKQKGRDPLSPNVGNRWEEALIEEVPPEVLMTDIQNSVALVSTAASVKFGTIIDNNNVPYLTYDIEVAL